MEGKWRENPRLSQDCRYQKLRDVALSNDALREESNLNCVQQHLKRMSSSLSRRWDNISHLVRVSDTSLFFFDQHTEASSREAAVVVIEHLNFWSSAPTIRRVEHWLCNMSSIITLRPSFIQEEAFQ